MGPRSADRGISAALADIPEAVLASMGPRSADRGIASRYAKPTALLMLQWGRDQLIAELGLCWLLVCRLRVASMGPRSADRGISSRSFYSVFNDLRARPRAPLHFTSKLQFLTTCETRNSRLSETL